MTPYSYPAVFEAGDNPDITVVTFPDLPEAITEGTGMEDASAMASDALGLVLLTYMQLGRELPIPGADGVMVSPSPDVAAQLDQFTT